MPMALEHTFQYTSMPAAQANAEFRRLLNEKDILFVIFGNDPLATKAVNWADAEAVNPQFGVNRRVIWLPDYLSEKEACLNLLSTYGPGFNAAEYEQTLGFSVKPVSNKTAFVLRRNSMTSDTVLRLSIGRAYAKAVIEDGPA